MREMRDQKKVQPTKLAKENHQTLSAALLHGEELIEVVERLADEVEAYHEQRAATLAEREQQEAEAKRADASDEEQTNE